MKQVLLFYLCSVKGVFWKVKRGYLKEICFIKISLKQTLFLRVSTMRTDWIKRCGINKGPRCMFLPSLGLVQDCLSNSVYLRKESVLRSRIQQSLSRDKHFLWKGNERNYKEFLNLHPSLCEVCPLWKSHYHLLSGSAIQASVFPRNCCIPTVQVISNTTLY